jgi:hypothetical protein
LLKVTGCRAIGSAKVDQRCPVYAKARLCCECNAFDLMPQMYVCNRRYGAFVSRLHVLLLPRGGASAVPQLWVTPSILE